MHDLVMVRRINPLLKNFQVLDLFYTCTNVLEQPYAMLLSSSVRKCGHLHIRQCRHASRLNHCVGSTPAHTSRGPQTAHIAQLAILNRRIGHRPHPPCCNKSSGSISHVYVSNSRWHHYSHDLRIRDLLQHYNTL